MKFLTYVAAVIVGAFGLLQIASADVIPPGSYQRTCRDFYTDGTTLSATCRTRFGRANFTTLRNYHECRGDIANVNGRLTCVDPEHDDHSPPDGSYRQTCRGERVEDGTLTAECLDRFGRWRYSELPNYRWCAGDIINADGMLRCRGGEGGYSRITLYVRRNYLGGYRTFTGDVPDLNAYGLGNLISSVVVQRGLWQLCDRPYFGGDCIMISRSEPRLYQRRFEDRAESLRRVR